MPRPGGDALALAGVEGTAPQRVLVFDDDHYYLGGVLAELLAGLGHQVRLVTPAPLVSSWTANTLEIGDIQRRVLGAGIVVSANQVLVAVGAGEARTACAFTGTETVVAADAVLMVTARIPRDDLYLALEQRQDEWQARGVRSVRCVGDAWAPSTIAGAVWAGRRYAEELDTPGPPSRDRNYQREYTALAADYSPGTSALGASAGGASAWVAACPAADCPAADCPVADCPVADCRAVSRAWRRVGAPAA